MVLMSHWVVGQRCTALRLRLLDCLPPTPPPPGDSRSPVMGRSTWPLRRPPGPPHNRAAGTGTGTETGSVNGSGSEIETVTENESGTESGREKERENGRENGKENGKERGKERGTTSGPQRTWPTPLLR